MDHAEALERIEIAAAEPDGLERLMAGDTPDAAAVAGHLAGCPSCSEQLVAIRRTAVLARHVIEAEPDPELKERTLAFVRAVGRERPLRDQAGGAVPSERPAAPHVPDGGRTTRLPRWVAYGAIAAAIVIAFAAGIGGALVVRPDTRAEAFVLRETVEAGVAIGAQPDATRVSLAGTDAASSATGSVLFSAATGELVMVATGLQAPPAGMEYGCWIETGGERRRIGKLYPGGDLQAWVGDVEGLDAAVPGTLFGVTLVPVDGGSGDAGETVLEGEV